MRYVDGREVQIGDKVTLENGAYGEVVCSVDSHKFSPQYPQSAWQYLNRGVLVSFAKYGLIHYEVLEPGLRFVERAGSKVEK